MKRAMSIQCAVLREPENSGVSVRHSLFKWFVYLGVSLLVVAPSALAGQSEALVACEIGPPFLKEILTKSAIAGQESDDLVIFTARVVRPGEAAYWRLPDSRVGDLVVAWTLSESRKRSAYWIAGFQLNGSTMTPYVAGGCSMRNVAENGVRSVANVASGAEIQFKNDQVGARLS